MIPPLRHCQDDKGDRTHKLPAQGQAQIQHSINTSCCHYIIDAGEDKLVNIILQCHWILARIIKITQKNHLIFLFCLIII